MVIFYPWQLRIVGIVTGMHILRAFDISLNIVQKILLTFFTIIHTLGGKSYYQFQYYEHQTCILLFC